MNKLKQLEKYAQFEDLSITPRRVQLTDGEDGDSMWLVSPETDKDCRYHGYRIQNTACDGGYEFHVWSMLYGGEVDVPFPIRFNLGDVKVWIDNNLANLEDKIAKLKAELKREEEIRHQALEVSKKKNADRFCGFSSSTYYKVRKAVACDDDATTELLTRFVLRQRGLCGNIEEQAYTIHTLHELGLLKMNDLKKHVKKLG